MVFAHGITTLSLIDWTISVGLFVMTHDNSASVLPFSGSQKIQPPLFEPTDSCFGVVLQGSFAMDADREEFVQTIVSHGITFLRRADSPLPQPSTDDLSMLEKIARILSGIWTRRTSTEAL